MALSFMEGNEAIALGAMAAGCNFFAGYPITPATTIFNTMLKLLPPGGGVCLQGEDEIASMGYCLGAAMGGAKAMTATSGPGISLYSEQISFAIGSEIPVVIVDIQRLGPSTGSATRGADGDIQFLQWGSSGGQPVVVLAPVDIKDCYTLTMHAFNLAERFRCPVFIASNKEIGMTRESIDIDALHRPPVIHRSCAPENVPFLPFAAPADDRAPDFLPMGGDTLVRQTSSTHGPDGYITTDAQVIAQTQMRLTNKLTSKIHEFSFYEEAGMAGADTLVIVYGVTARAAKVAVEEANRDGHRISLLVLKTLWPVPEDLIRQKAESARQVMVVEMNLGQYVREIQRVLSDKKIAFLGQMNGNLITPRQIRRFITHA